MATVMQPQEANHKSASVTRAFDQTRDCLDQLKGQLAIARRDKRHLRILELEAELPQAIDALAKATHEYERHFGVTLPRSTGPELKLDSANALRATNDEFRKIDDEANKYEREINFLEPQVQKIEKALAALGPVPSGGPASDPAAEAVLDQIYPERIGIRMKNIERLNGAVRSNVELQIQLADLRERLAKFINAWTVARTRRDAMFAEYLAGVAR